MWSQENKLNYNLFFLPYWQSFFFVLSIIITKCSVFFVNVGKISHLTVFTPIRADIKDRKIKKYSKIKDALKSAPSYFLNKIFIFGCSIYRISILWIHSLKTSLKSYSILLLSVDIKMPHIHCFVWPLKQIMAASKNHISRKLVCWINNYFTISKKVCSIYRSMNVKWMYYICHAVIIAWSASTSWNSYAHVTPPPGSTRS